MGYSSARLVTKDGSITIRKPFSIVPEVAQDYFCCSYGKNKTKHCEMFVLKEFSIMNEFDERQRKRRNYEREQEDLQLIAQEKERIIKKVWLNFSILSLLVWILYGTMVSSLKAEYINLVVIITLSVQILLFARAVLKRNKLRK